MDQLRNPFGQNFSQRRNVGLIGFNPSLEIVRQVSAQFVRMAGQCEENRMKGVFGERPELMPCLAAKSDAEQAVGRDIYELKRGQKIAGIVFQIFSSRHRKAKLGTAAAGHRRKNPMSGMAMEWMPLRPYDERIERSGVPQCEVRSPKFCRRFLKCVDIFRMSLLSGGDAVKQVASRAMSQLCDQRNFDREAVLRVWDDNRWKCANDTRQLRHCILTEFRDADVALFLRII